jgi:hypothetical protein
MKKKIDTEELVKFVGDFLGKPRDVFEHFLKDPELDAGFFNAAGYNLEFDIAASYCQARLKGNRPAESLRYAYGEWDV